MGNTAFVTGSSRGIGRAVALRLARDGWDVAIHCRERLEEAERTAAAVRSLGQRSAAVAGDLRQGTAITAAIRRCEEVLGPVELLVNNAGIALQAQFQDTTEAQWRDLFAVNVDGPYHAIQAVLPHMLHEKRGCIVNLSSIWGLRGASCEVGYAATKAAVIGLTRSLAAELAPSGIRVNCVAPGVIQTEMTQALGQETLSALAEETPLGRLGTPEDVAAAVAFFAREEAGFLTGQVLTADGGFIL